MSDDRSAPRSANLRPFKKGYDPRRGHGKKGRSGRPPEAFRKFLARMRRDPEFQAAFERVLKDGTSKNWPSAVAALMKYDTHAAPVGRGVVVVPAEELPAARELAQAQFRRLAGSASTVPEAELEGYEYVDVDETPSEMRERTDDLDACGPASPPILSLEQVILARRHAERERRGR